MIKNAMLSIKKNMGRSLLLFVIMLIITNLIIAGLSIKSATQKSIDSLQASLGNEVTLSTNFKNMMKNREQGQSIEDVSSNMTISMADQLKALKYVDAYNYQISVGANSDSLTPVALETSDDDNTPTDMPSDKGGNSTMTSTDFTIDANTSMENLSDFTSKNSTLIDGRLLKESDSGTNNTVIETNLAKENDLKVGDTITINTIVDDQTITQDLVIVGIYEISETTQIGGPNRSNPVNTIYTPLTIGQTLTASTTNLTSASFYLNDPENVDAYIELAKSKTDIDFDTYQLQSNDQLYQQNISNLENTSSFVNIFLWVVVIAGCAILALILILTIRNRYYEIGVFLSLGQNKIKIIGQQLLEIGCIAIIAFILSLGTGKMVSNMISGVLVDNSSSSQVVMDMKDQNSSSNSSSRGMGGRMDFNNAFNQPQSEELDVSLTSSTAIQLAGITAAICVISTLVPSIYVLRLSPREILVRKEG